MTTRKTPIIMVYGQPGCMQCTMTTKVLNQKRVPYTYVDVVEFPEVGERLYAEGCRGLPVVEVRDPAGNPRDRWTGFRAERLRALAVEKDPSPSK